MVEQMQHVGPNALNIFEDSLCSIAVSKLEQAFADAIKLQSPTDQKLVFDKIK